MRHLDDDLLLRVLHGQTSPRHLLQTIYAHLRDLCPECRANLELVAAEMGWLLDPAAAPSASPETSAAEPSAGDDSAYKAAFESAAFAAVDCARRIDEERAQARRSLTALRELPPAQRRGRLAFGPDRLRSRSLAESILQDARDRVRNEPDDAREMVELVPLMLARMSGTGGQPWAEELEARALAHRGNAFRVAGDLAAAEAAFLALHRFLGERNLRLDDLHQEVASLEASLRREQGRYRDAVELLDTAIKLVQVAGDSEELASLLVKRGDVHRLAENPDAAGHDLRRALALLDPEATPHLFRCAVGSYCFHLCEVGDYEQAEALLERHRATFECPDDPWAGVRRTGLRGYIAHGRGQLAAAERRFLEVRDWYAGHDQPFRAALSSLDLARLYLEQGRHRELAELARWMGKVFESRELPTRTAVALMLFQQAVAAQQISVEALRGLRICLEPGPNPPEALVVSSRTAPIAPRGPRGNRRSVPSPDPARRLHQTSRAPLRIQGRDEVHHAGRGVQPVAGSFFGGAAEPPRHRRSGRLAARCKDPLR